MQGCGEISAIIEEEGFFIIRNLVHVRCNRTEQLGNGWFSDSWQERSLVELRNRESLSDYQKLELWAYQATRVW